MVFVRKSPGRSGSTKVQIAERRDGRDVVLEHVGLTIVFAALAVARHLQNATGLSIRKIVNTLRPLQQIAVRIAGHEHLAEDPITPTAEAILDALKFSPQ